MNDNIHPDSVYLHPSTKIEPLCSRWYAWSHVISPIQQAMNITYRQIPLLKSFIANPAVHERALSDLKFLGGSFVHLKKSDVPAAKSLLQTMNSECSELIRFAEEYVKFDRQLQANAKGGSIDHLYEQLPERLSGVTEILYDMNSHPTLRVFEELLYGGPLKNEEQQELCFFQAKDEDRSFFLNTPRLDSPDRFFVRMPFSDPKIDLLAAARLNPVSFGELSKALNVPAESESDFRKYFTTTPPPRNAPDYTGDDVRIRYFGHACALIQTSKVSVLIDPLVAWENDDENTRLTFSDLPDKIDYVFLTHNHHDHYAPEVLLQLRNRIGRILVARNNPNNIADTSMKLTLNSIGFTNVDVLDPMSRIELPDGFLVSLPFYGEHAALSVTSKHGMYLSLKGRKFVFLADSDCLDRVLYRRIVQRLGKADVLFIGMECQGAPLSWCYGPYLTNPISRKDDEARRSSGSDSNRAFALLEEFGCTKAFVYAMGQEPWLRYQLDLIYEPDSKQIVESNKFVARCNESGIPCERLLGCRDFHF